MSHVRLAPSAAHRWMACPGSVAAEAPYPDSSSPHARAGTAAHKLGEWCLTTGRSPYDRVGETIGVEGYDVEITEEMAEAVRVYARVCGQLLDRAVKAAKYMNVPVEYGVESRVSLAPLGPPAEMGGTADFWALNPAIRELVVCDLKYGKGVAVSAHDNVQTRYYALGVWVHLMTRENALPRDAVRTVRTIIVQPRLTDEDGDPRITEDTFDIDDLRKWAKNKLLPAAREATEPGAPRAAGDHCRFCKAKADCPTLRGVALATAEQEFSVFVDQPEPVVPNPAALTPEDVGAILLKLPLLEDWMAAVRARAEELLAHGETVPGWARKPKRAVRKWRSEQEAAEWLRSEHGADDGEVYDRKLKSPAQIEKLVGKGSIPEELVVAESSGFNLCRDSDPRALPSGINEFDVTVE